MPACQTGRPALEATVTQSRTPTASREHECWPCRAPCAEPELRPPPIQLLRRMVAPTKLAGAMAARPRPSSGQRVAAAGWKQECRPRRAHGRHHQPRTRHPHRARLTRNSAPPSCTKLPLARRLPARGAPNYCDAMQLPRSRLSGTHSGVRDIDPTSVCAPHLTSLN